jgi:membrane protease YdiL (CAAX protease family)
LIIGTTAGAVDHAVSLDIGSVRITERFFTWLPDAILQMSVVEGGETIGTGTLIVLLACFFLFNGLVGPVVEELYFRGHLLPRIDRFKAGAPIINAVLFSLYHLWTPWRWPSILIGYLPISWLAWRKRSVWLPMTAHIIVNNIFILLVLATFLSDT